ncbi:hypothetical protein FB451DRAFT_684732 [Mycena latifolia]|nr:hypothetical protein FB451DRAFT_684732 [Mycena latifolia]
MSGARGCFNCGGFGHQAASCPKAGTPTCYNCASSPTILVVADIKGALDRRPRGPRVARLYDGGQTQVVLQVRHGGTHRTRFCLPTIRFAHKVHSPATALIVPAVAQAASPPVAEEGEVQAPSATDAARLGTLPARAPRLGMFPSSLFPASSTG